MIFVDSNIPMYLVGAPHPHKVDAQRLIERARTIVLGRRSLSARDALHVSVMEREGIARILSFDTGFDGYPGITRIGE